MLNFKEWLRLDELRVDQDIATQASQSSARDLGRDANHIIACLLKKTKNWDVELTPHMGVEDTIDKIDGYYRSGSYTGRSMQISRRLSAGSQDDYAIRLTDRMRTEEQFYDRNVREIIEQSDSKISAAADTFVMLNADDDKIYISESSAMRNILNKALTELEQNPRHQGALTAMNRVFWSSDRVNLRLAKARDGYAILAYIPARVVVKEIVRVTQEQVDNCTSAHQQAKEAQAEAERQALIAAETERARAAAEREATRKKSDLEIAIQTAKASGAATLVLAGNPKAVQNKLANIKKIATQNQLKTNFESRTNTVTLSV